MRFKPQTRQIGALLISVNLIACSTTPPREIIPAPLFEDHLRASLAKVVTPENCNIETCASLETAENYFICKGKYSFLTATDATEFYRQAVDQLEMEFVTVEIVADESTGSASTAMVIVTIGAILAAVLIAGLSGGHSGSSGFYIPSRISDDIQITVKKTSQKEL